MQFKSYLQSLPQGERDKLLRLASAHIDDKFASSQGRQSATHVANTGPLAATTPSPAAATIDRLFKQAENQVLETTASTAPNIMLLSSSPAPQRASTWKLTAAVPHNNPVYEHQDAQPFHPSEAGHQKITITATTAARTSPAASKTPARKSTTSPGRTSLRTKVSPSSTRVSPSTTTVSPSSTRVSPTASRKSISPGPHAPSPSSPRAASLRASQDFLLGAHCPLGQGSRSGSGKLCRDGNVEWQLAQATVKASLLRGDKQELEMKLAAVQQESADLRAQIAALKASHASQQQELGKQYDSELAQLRALASGLGRSMQQVSELSRSAAAQNSALQEALDATKAAWEQDQKMVEQQSQRIDHLERQLLQVGKRGRPWGAAAAAASRSPSPGPPAGASRQSRPISAPYTSVPSGRQPMQPLLDQLEAAKRRESALRDRVAALTAQAQQVKGSASQQQVQLQQEREQLQRALSKESSAAAAASKKAAVAQQQVAALEQQVGSRERYVQQLERKLVSQHKELQQLRQRLRSEEQQRQVQAVEQAHRQAQALVAHASAQQQLSPRHSLFVVEAGAGQPGKEPGSRQQQQGAMQEISFSLPASPGAGDNGSVAAECGDADEDGSFMPALASAMKKVMRVTDGSGAATTLGSRAAAAAAAGEAGSQRRAAASLFNGTASQGRSGEDAVDLRVRHQVAEAMKDRGEPETALQLLLDRVEVLQSSLLSFEGQLAQAGSAVARGEPWAGGLVQGAGQEGGAGMQ